MKRIEFLGPSQEGWSAWRDEEGIHFEYEDIDPYMGGTLHLSLGEWADLVKALAQDMRKPPRT